MSYVVLIPARMNSQRLPGKPLADIHGKPMIQRVFEQAQLSDASRVVVATEDSIIFDCVSGFGGEVVMTSSHHQSGTDRAAEACNTLEISADVTIVNVQGDEPLIPPACINQVARDLEKPGCDMATLCQPLAESSQWLDPNVVKFVDEFRRLKQGIKSGAKKRAKIPAKKMPAKKAKTPTKQKQDQAAMTKARAFKNDASKEDQIAFLKRFAPTR